MSGVSEKLSIVNEVAHPGSPGIYRRISATKELLIEETNAVRLRHQKQLEHEPLKSSSSLKLNLLNHEKIRRAWSTGDAKGSYLLWPSSSAKNQRREVTPRRETRRVVCASGCERMPCNTMCGAPRI